MIHSETPYQLKMWDNTLYGKLQEKKRCYMFLADQTVQNTQDRSCIDGRTSLVGSLP